MRDEEIFIFCGHSLCVRHFSCFFFVHLFCNIFYAVIFFFFWENIIFLESLRDKEIFSNSFINERINFILCEALGKSNFNQYFYNNPNIKRLQELLCPDYLYFRYNLVPVYFNNYYEVYHLFLRNNNISFNVVYSIHNKCFNMFEFYQFIKENNKLPLTNMERNINNSVLRSISNLILRVSRGLIYSDNFIATPNNSIFEAYKMAVQSGQIEKLEGVNIKRVFGFDLIVITGPGKRFTGYFLVDNIDQLKFLVNDEVRLIRSSWETFVDSPMAMDIIKSNPILWNEYILTGTLNLNLKNIDILILLNNRNNNFFGYTPDRFTSPEMRAEFYKILNGFKQKIVLINIIQDYLKRS